jgi:hypothetical protein
MRKMTLMGFEKVKKIAERQWRLKTTLIFRPTLVLPGFKKTIGAFKFHN